MEDSVTKQVPVVCGPPYLNGNLHAGHAINLVVKDFFNRYYKQILGQDFEYWYNFDAQGLPIEYLVKKTFKDLSSKELLEKCLQVVNNNFLQAKSTLELLNLMDLDKFLTTKDLRYKVQLMNCLADLYDCKKLAKREKVLDYCFNCQGVLANAQVEYVTKRPKIYTFKAKLTSGIHKDKFLFFATTRPESLVNNRYLAIAKGTYQEIKYRGESAILRDPKKTTQFASCETQSSIESLQLIGSTYALEIGSKILKGKVLESALVKTEQVMDPYLMAIGCVHLSPFNSRIDYQELKALGLYHASESDIKEALELCQKSKIQEDFFTAAPITQYVKEVERPVCWKCKHESVEVLSVQYFLILNPEERKQMVQQIEQITLNNPNYRSTLVSYFSKEVDWCVSRGRVYGTPLPLATCSNPSCGTQQSVRYAIEDFKSEIQCFYPYLSTVLQNRKELCKVCGNPVVPVDQSIDVWVDAGFLSCYLNQRSMMYIEGRDQIRGWFYSSAVINKLLNKTLPYKGLLILGWILSDSKNKISKSVGGYLSIPQIVDQGGLLNFRSFALSKASSRDTPFSIPLIQEEKKYVNCMHNAASFLKKIAHQWKDLPLEKLHQIAQSTSNSLELKQFEQLIQGLNQSVKSLNPHKYWLELKKYFLETYSRQLINKMKKDLTKENLIFLLYIGKMLYFYSTPVLGVNLLETD